MLSQMLTPVNTNDQNKLSHHRYSLFRADKCKLSILAQYFLCSEVIKIDYFINVTQNTSKIRQRSNSMWIFAYAGGYKVANNHLSTNVSMNIWVCVIEPLPKSAPINQHLAVVNITIIKNVLFSKFRCSITVEKTKLSGIVYIFVRICVNSYFWVAISRNRISAENCKDCF